MLTTSPQGDRLDTLGVCWTIFDHGLSTDLNIFQKQYRNKIQTELFYNYDGFFLFSTHKSSDYASIAKLKKKLKIVLVLLNYA
jgi:hypothetical protein